MGKGGFYLVLFQFDFELVVCQTVGNTKVC